MNALARDLRASRLPISPDMDDAQFLAALERCTLAPEVFTHRNHLRAAYLYLTRLPFGAAIDAMCGTLRRYTAHLGAADKYHETITVAFMALGNARARGVFLLEPRVPAA